MPNRFLNAHPQVGIEMISFFKHGGGVAAPLEEDQVERIIGTVRSGRGRAAGHLAVAAPEMEGLLGNPPVSGSLNLVLRHPLAFDPNRAVLSVEGGRRFWPVRLEGLPCLAYRWNSCPLHIVEVVSDRHLRSELALTDESEVAIEVPQDMLVSVHLRQRFAWMALWGWDGSRYYTDDAYTQWAKRRRMLWLYTVQQSVGCTRD